MQGSLFEKDRVEPIDLPKSIKPPSQHLADLLSGRVAYADTPPAIQSWARFAIYEGAVSLLRIKEKESRNAALLKVPDTLRDLVRDEVIRLWGMRG